MCADGGRKGDIRVTGINTTTLVAGRIEICAWEEWRAVCHGSWDIREAMVVCRQLGFFPQGILTIHTHIYKTISSYLSGTLFCTKSCFGKDNKIGLYDWGCNGNESKLQDCLTPVSNTSNCGEAAGVICSKEDPFTTVSNVSTDNETAECTTPSKPYATGMAALAGGLGGLSVILAILLAGVVTGWVWSCYRRSRMGLQER